MPTRPERKGGLPAVCWRDSRQLPWVEAVLATVTFAACAAHMGSTPHHPVRRRHSTGHERTLSAQERLSCCQQDECSVVATLQSPAPYSVAEQQMLSPERYLLHSLLTC